jgi:hypothetical protein
MLTNLNAAVGLIPCSINLYDHQVRFFFCGVGLSISVNRQASHQDIPCSHSLIFQNRLLVCLHCFWGPQIATNLQAPVHDIPLSHSLSFHIYCYPLFIYCNQLMDTTLGTRFYLVRPLQCVNIYAALTCQGAHTICALDKLHTC